jgi:transposase, IS5 family
MIIDRYDPVNLFALVPQLELEMEPALSHLDRLLDDDVLFQQVKQDLSQRFPLSPRRGRRSTPVEVILRLLVVKHLYGWSYEQTEHFVNDSLVLRQFCRLYLAKAPDDTTLLRWANLIQPATLHALLDRVVELARTNKVTRGRKLRIDGTVVETNMHYPTDSTLLADGVRVLSRTLTKARAVVAQTAAVGRGVFRNRSRSAKQQARRILEATRQRGQQAEQTLQAAYHHLLATTQAVVKQARQAVTMLHHQANGTAQKLAETLQVFIPRVEQVITQTTRRVLHGETVPAHEKIVSLFEPHTAIIRKGKLAQPTEFGRVVWLDEVDGGIISRYAVLEGNPREETQVHPSIAHHLALFDHPPNLVAGDRGTYSPTGERYAQDQGVKQVVLPQPGRKSAARQAYEQQRWFRCGRRWRAGIEGRISGLKRRHGLDRCLYHGDTGMERWVGWGVIAHDLRVIARTVAA